MALLASQAFGECAEETGKQWRYALRVILRHIADHNVEEFTPEQEIAADVQEVCFPHAASGACHALTVVGSVPREP